jgi:hypothetical protein
MLINFCRTVTAIFSGVIVFFAGVVACAITLLGPGPLGSIKINGENPIGLAQWCIGVAPYAIYAVIFAFQFLVNVFSSRKNFGKSRIKILWYLQVILVVGLIIDLMNGANSKSVLFLGVMVINSLLLWITGAAVSKATTRSKIV